MNNSKQLQPVEQVRQNLAKAGFNFDDEVVLTVPEKTAIDLPRVKIEHRNNGRHRMYLDLGESYINQEEQEINFQNNELVGVIFATESIRALWKEGETLPACSAINGEPTVSDPISEQCKNCPKGKIGGECKPKQRLWMLIETDGKIKPVVFPLSPTSIKHWRSHANKLSRSQLPYVSVQTFMKLKDVKKNGYRWAEVEFDVMDLATDEQLEIAKQARTELEKFRQNITEKDFSDPGDKLDND